MKPFERTISLLDEMRQLEHAPLRVALRDASGIQSARAQGRKSVVEDHFWLFQQQGFYWIPPPGAVSGEELNLDEKEDDGRGEDVLDDLEIHFQSGDFLHKDSLDFCDLRLNPGNLGLEVRFGCQLGI